MSLNVRGDIYNDPTQTTTLGACASGTNFLIVTAEPRIRRFSITPTSMQQTASSAILAGTSPTDLVLMAPATAVVSYTGFARVDLYDINTFATTGISTNVTTANKNAPQQIAGIPALGLALETSGTGGRLTLISLTCAAALNPTVLSGKLADCIIPRLDANTWLIGTNDGRIIEMNSSATALTTVSLPSAPFITTPTIGVQSLAYYNSVVLASTDSGIMYAISWPSGNIISESLVSVGQSSATTISNAVSGVVLVSNNGSPPTYKGIQELYFDNPNSPIPGQDGCTFWEANVGCQVLGIEPTAQLYAWACSTSNTFIPNRIYTITSPQKVLVSTEIQNPIGNDVAARIIRLRDDNDIGNATVEIDQTVPPGIVSLQCTANRNYIELCLFGNVVNGNPPYTGWDIREMQS